MFIDLKTRYHRLLKKSKEGVENIDKSIEVLGKLIDCSQDLKELQGLNQALSLAQEIEKLSLTSDQKVVLYYFISNIWGAKYQITKVGKQSSWAWESEEVENQIIYLRKAVIEPNFITAEKQRSSQILTNLGNVLNHVGRSVEALETLHSAIEFLPIFGMPHANLATCLSDYAKLLPNRHDSLTLIVRGRDILRAALELQGFHDQALSYYGKYLEWFENVVIKIDLNNHNIVRPKSLGKSKKEILYRQWVGENNLFLNYLNDVFYDLTECSEDKIILPALTRPVGEKSCHFEGLFNQIKQEFVSARFLFFEAITSYQVHYSDRRVVLYDTLDYPSYSLAVEMIKTSFRLAYSILDKIAFFLNEYFQLSIKPNKVTFRTFWYQKGDSQFGLRAEFIDRPNWALRGLFWLSKDLYDKAENYKSAIEPDARELAEIRNHIEHKYLKVHQFRSPTEEMKEDELAFSIGRDEIIDKTLRILKIARSAIVYMSLGIHSEEIDRKKAYDKDKVGRISVYTYEDEWKL